MTSIIKSIHDFNSRAGLLTGYNDIRESSFPIEEALEGLTDLQCLARMLGSSDPSPKNISRIITALAHNGTDLQDVDRLDKACDIVVFAIGSMAKLGLSPLQIEQALEIVMLANNEKLGMPKDYYGKLGKPTAFVGPEVQLQQLLDER